MIVVDTSAVIGALTLWPLHTRLRDRLAPDKELHAPHLIDVEFSHALGRMVSRGVLSLARAHDARLDFADMLILRYGHESLLDRIWELRQNLSAYDAAYIALSEALDAPLITCDPKLAGAPGHHARIELYAS